MIFFILSEDDFSITQLAEDTGYTPGVTYEEIVTELYDYLIQEKKY